MRVRTPSHDPSKEPIPRHRRGTPCLAHFMRPAPLSPLTPMLGPSRRSAGAVERRALRGDKHDLLESDASLLQSLPSVPPRGRGLVREGRGNPLWPGALNLASHPPSLLTRRGSEPTKVARSGSRRRPAIFPRAGAQRVGRLGPDSLVTVNRLPPGGFHRRLTCFMGSPSCARALNAVLSSSYASGERGLFQDWLVGEYSAHVDESEPHLSFFFLIRVADVFL